MIEKLYEDIHIKDYMFVIRKKLNEIIDAVNHSVGREQYNLNETATMKRLNDIENQLPEMKERDNKNTICNNANYDAIIETRKKIEEHLFNSNPVASKEEFKIASDNCFNCPWHDEVISLRKMKEELNKYVSERFGNKI